VKSLYVKSILTLFGNDAQAHNAPLAILITIIAVLSFKVMAVSNTDPFQHFEWVADTGTNRFVTNTLSDFIPSSIREISTPVNVGNGRYVVKKEGTVVVRTPNGNTIACKRVLYMPKCGKKLMPATSFVRQGCTIILKDDKIRLMAPDNSVLLEGREIQGLYYFECRTCHNDEAGRIHVTLKDDQRTPSDSK
jgi:hypothetical protein